MTRHRLGPVQDVPEGGSKGYNINGDALFAVRKDNHIHLYRNQCPHAGIPLEWVPDQFLDHSGTLIQCANHGALFIIETGACVRGPCSGQSLEPVTHEILDGDLYAIDIENS